MFKGRVDRIEYIGLANYEMIKAMFMRFYQNNEELFSQYFQDKDLINNKLSMATLQGLFLQEKVWN